MTLRCNVEASLVRPGDLVVPWALFCAAPDWYARLAGEMRVVVLGRHHRPAMALSCPEVA